MKARIVRLGGYNGLPTQFMVESKYGWLGENSFTPMEKAIIFSSEKQALDKFKALFPHFDLRTN